MPSTMSLLDQSKELQAEIIEVRRHLHQYPELSFEEVETSKLAAERLKELGYAIKSGIAGTGITADIGSGARTIAIRADMDALPVDEAKDRPYRSKREGVMHACGHDAHVSSALAAAKLLAREETLPGRVRIIMQPAEEDVDEEGWSGAYRMIEQGAMEGVDAVIGLHMDASIPAGKVAIMHGPVMAAADGFRITIKGQGGHGAYPEATIDAVVIAAQIVQAIQQIVSRRIPAIEPAVVTIGSIHSSSIRGNVISDRVELLGTIRSFNEDIRKKLIKEVDRVCSMAKALGGDYETEYEMGYPATVNEPRITEVMRKAAVDTIGAENVIAVPLKTWAEDFSMLAQAAPGCFMFLGGEIAGDRRAHHSPTFDLDESGLHIGPAILAETARRLLLES
ncbi:MAG: amidohydrolase [Candidatus Obscuribacterales bacterium]